MTESIKMESEERARNEDQDMDLIGSLIISLMEVPIPRVYLEFRILSWVVIA